MLRFLSSLRFETVEGAAPLGPVGEPVGSSEPVPSELEQALGELDPIDDEEGMAPAGEQGLTLEGLAQALAQSQSQVSEMYEYLVQQNERLNTPPPPPDAPVEPPRWDPLDPQSVGEYLSHHFGGMLDERFAPLMPLLETFAESQGEQVANQQFDQIEKQIGPFDRKQALDRALWMIESASIPPDQAVQYAAQEQRAFEQKIAQDAITAYEARVAGALDADGDVPAVGAGAERDEPLPSGRGQSRSAYREQGRRSLARMNLRAVQ